MLSSSAAAAVAQLQQRAGETHDLYQLDRYDRAIDEVLRHPDKQTPAPFQCRSALANAAKVLKNRRDICRMTSLEAQTTTLSDHVDHVCGATVDVVDIHIWLETTPSLGADHRQLLQALAAGDDTWTLAAKHGVPVNRMRERISRARAAGWDAYRSEVLER